VKSKIYHEKNYNGSGGHGLCGFSTDRRAGGSGAGKICQSQASRTPSWPFWTPQNSPPNQLNKMQKVKWYHYEKNQSIHELEFRVSWHHISMVNFRAKQEGGRIRSQHIHHYYHASHYGALRTQHTISVERITTPKSKLGRHRDKFTLSVFRAVVQLRNSRPHY
jgi:hypothetical protein